MTTMIQKAKNERSLLLNDHENETIFSAIGRGCFTLATAVIQLYLAEAPQRQRWNKRFCGVVCFVKDNSKKSYFIRVYDIKNKQLLWEQELYNQFKYKAPRDYFHTFEANDCQAALNFASEDEAAKFKKAIEGKLLERHKRRLEKKKDKQGTAAPSPPAPSPGGGNITVGTGPPPSMANVSLNKPSAATSSAKDNKSKKDKGKGKKKVRLTKEDISTPTDFRHVNHVGWDPQKGLDTNHLDPEMKTLFEQIGISDQAVDEETIDFIYDFVDKHGGLDAVRQDLAKRQTPSSPPPLHANHGGAPPPPPPAGRSPRGPPPPARGPGGAPPPPPPHRGGGPPPPPPGRPGITAPPPPPNRQAAPPPPPPNRTPGFGGPPPPPPPGNVPAPPPPPPAMPAAPAPPPPPPAFGGGDPGGPPLPPANAGRSGLLDAIHKGTTLKKVTASEKGSGGDARSGLLDQIKSGKTLKSVEHSSDSGPAASEPEGIVGALAAALAARKNVIQSSDDEDDSDDMDIDDDDEWDD